MERKKYDAEFKRRVIELAITSGKTDNQMESDLGLFQGALGKWRQDYKNDPASAFPGQGKLKPLDEEIRRLRRENDILRQERDILKKAMAIFSRPQKAGIGL